MKKATSNTHTAAWFPVVHRYMSTTCGQNAGLMHKWAVPALMPPGRNKIFDISHPGRVVNHKSIVHGTTGVNNRLIGGNYVPHPTKVAAAM